MKLVVYTNNSPSSNAAREFLRKHQLEFEEVNATTPQGAYRLQRRTQQNRLPAFEIKKSHSVHVVAGFNDFAVSVLTKELGLKEETVQKTLESF